MCIRDRNSTFTNLTNLDLFMNAVTANFEDVTTVSIPSTSLEAVSYTHLYRMRGSDGTAAFFCVGGFFSGGMMSSFWGRDL